MSRRTQPSQNDIGMIESPGRVHSDDDQSLPDIGGVSLGDDDSGLQTSEAEYGGSSDIGSDDAGHLGYAEDGDEEEENDVEVGGAGDSNAGEGPVGLGIRIPEGNLFSGGGGLNGRRAEDHLVSTGSPHRATHEPYIADLNSPTRRTILGRSPTRTENPSSTSQSSLDASSEDNQSTVVATSQQDRSPTRSAFGSDTSTSYADAVIRGPVPFPTILAQIPQTQPDVLTQESQSTIDTQESQSVVNAQESQPTTVTQESPSTINTEEPPEPYGSPQMRALMRTIDQMRDFPSLQGGALAVFEEAKATRYPHLDNRRNALFDSYNKFLSELYSDDTIFTRPEPPIIDPFFRHLIGILLKFYHSLPVPNDKELDDWERRVSEWSMVDDIGDLQIDERFELAQRIPAGKVGRGSGDFKWFLRNWQGVETSDWLKMGFATTLEQDLADGEMMVEHARSLYERKAKAARKYLLGIDMRKTFYDSGTFERIDVLRGVHLGDVAVQTCQQLSEAAVKLGRAIREVEEASKHMKIVLDKVTEEEARLEEEAHVEDEAQVEDEAWIEAQAQTACH